VYISRSRICGTIREPSLAQNAQLPLMVLLMTVGKSSDVKIARLEKAADTKNFPMKAKTVA